MRGRAATDPARLSGSEFMSRPPTLTHRSLLCCFLIAWFSGTAVADGEKAEPIDDADLVVPGVAQSLKYALESFEEFEEIRSAHGARAEIAWKRIQIGDERSRVLQQVQDGDAVVHTWPQNRYHWSVQQLEDFNTLQRYHQYLNGLDRDLRTLEQQGRMLDEAARMQAQFKGKAAIPLDREGLLREFERLGDKKLRAYVAAKLAVGEAAEESKQTPTVILQKAAAQINSRAATPQTLKPFIAEFKAFYGKSKSKGKHPTGKPARTPARKPPVESFDLN